MSSQLTPPSLKDFSLEVARGNVSGMSAVNKFGRNIAIASGITEDIWDQSAAWVAPTVARVHTIASTAAADDGPAGVGARTMRIYGLTDWDTAEVSEDVTLDGAGANAVQTANSYVIVHRMKVLTAGGTNTNAGLITATANTDTTVTASILAEQGQTQMAIYGIPSTQKAYMTSFYCDVNKSGGSAGAVDVALLFNPEPGDAATTWLTKITVGLLTTGSSHIGHVYDPPNEFVGPGILKLAATSGFSSADVSAGFDLILVDN